MAMNRRTVLKAGLGVTTLGAAVGFAVVSPVAADQAGGGKVAKLPRFDGRLHLGGPRLDEVAEDFGHLISRTPAAVLEPASTADVVTMVNWARKEGRRVAARGEGHSVYGRSQVDRGVVIDMSGLSRVHSVGGDRIVVGAGAKWSEVVAATLPKGLLPPVLPDYLELSVGGTLVVGGVGGTSFRYGVQSDNVIELEVVTGAGKVITCSATRERELFDAVRAGLGQVGIITRATLALIPAAPSARRYTLVYPSLAAMVAEQRGLLADGRFDYLTGAVLPTPTGGWTPTLEGVVLFDGTPPDDAAVLDGLSDIRERAALATLTHRDHLGKLAPLEQLLRSTGEWFHPHPWLTTFVGDAAVTEVAEGLLADLTPADVGKYGRMVVSPILRSEITSPMLRVPADEVFFAVNVLRFPPDDDALVARLVADNRAAYERVRAAGGTLYPVSAFPMSRDDWKAHLGSAYDALARARAKHDPGNILAPGYEVV